MQWILDSGQVHTFQNIASSRWFWVYSVKPLVRTNSIIMSNISNCAKSDFEIKLRAEEQTGLRVVGLWAYTLQA